jgi:hypothetical protein
VRDANGHPLAYVYFEDEPGRRLGPPRNDSELAADAFPARASRVVAGERKANTGFLASRFGSPGFRCPNNVSLNLRLQCPRSSLNLWKPGCVIKSE